MHNSKHQCASITHASFVPPTKEPPSDPGADKDYVALTLTRHATAHASALNSTCMCSHASFHASHVTFCPTHVLQVSFRLAKMADGAGIKFHVHVRCEERETQEARSARAGNVHDNGSTHVHESASKSEAVTDANGALEFTVALKMCRRKGILESVSAEDSAWGITRSAYPTVAVMRHHVNEEMPDAQSLVA